MLTGFLSVTLARDVLSRLAPQVRTLAGAGVHRGALGPCGLSEAEKKDWMLGV